MARRDTDLTSLATLAGLAYMMSNKKDKKDATSTPSSGPSAEKLSAAKQTLDASMRGGPEEEAAPTGMGEATKFANAGTSSTAPVRTPVRAAAPMGGSGRGGQGGATAEELAAYAASKKPALRYQSLQDRARAYEEERAAAGAPGMYGTPSVRREPLPTASDMAYKKGGKVKKMASGGVTKVSSASRRADGIASKGKTRGKIC